METKTSRILHTQGEWTDALTGIKDEKGRLIAQCWCGDANNNDSYGRLQSVTYTEMQGNSRLIAAAPNMLKALQEALEVYENKEQNGGGLAVYEIGIKLTIVDAITKATNP